MVSAIDSPTTQAPAATSSNALAVIAELQPAAIHATSSTSLRELMHQAVNDSATANLVSAVVEGVVNTVGDSDPEQDTVSNDNDNSQTITPQMNLKLMHQPDFLGSNALNEEPNEGLRIFLAQAVLIILMSDPSSDIQKIFSLMSISECRNILSTYQ